MHINFSDIPRFMETLKQKQQWLQSSDNFNYGNSSNVKKIMTPHHAPPKKKSLMYFYVPVFLLSSDNLSILQK